VIYLSRARGEPDCFTKLNIRGREGSIFWFSLPGDSVFRHHGAVSRTLRIGLRWAGGGFAAVILGLVASGGFGSCGPRHEAPFVIAITGSACFLAGLCHIAYWLCPNWHSKTKKPFIRSELEKFSGEQEFLKPLKPASLKIPPPKVLSSNVRNPSELLLEQLPDSLRSHKDEQQNHTIKRNFFRT
jgi:hypothetical protein